MTYVDKLSQLGRGGGTLNSVSAAGEVAVWNHKDNKIN